jgi:hypothetical protein
MLTVFEAIMAIAGKMPAIAIRRGEVRGQAASPEST